MRIAACFFLGLGSLLAQDALVEQGLKAYRSGSSAEAAEAFRKAVELDGSNKTAISALGTMAVQAERWDEADTWYRRLLQLEPENAATHYTLGVIAWSKWYPAYSEARSRSTLFPGWTGLLSDESLRRNLRGEWWPILEQGIWHLNRAVELDPKHEDAMTMLARVLRQRAEIRERPEEYGRDLAMAREWSEKIQAPRRRIMILTPGNSERLLVEKHDPVYPPLAREANIQGTVKLGLVIDADGAVQEIEVISGHPMLVPAALQAVKQWRYRPMLSRGQRALARTQVELKFTLPR